MFGLDGREIYRACRDTRAETTCRFSLGPIFRELLLVLDYNLGGLGLFVGCA